MTNEELQRIIDDLDRAADHFPPAWFAGIHGSIKRASAILCELSDEVVAALPEEGAFEKAQTPTMP